MRKGTHQNAAGLLTASAATLLACPVAAEAPPDRAEVSLRMSQYAEDDLPETAVLPGAATERYTIDIQQLSFLTPVASSFAFRADAIRETMTGASPIGNVKVSDRDVRVAMSGASISEERNDIALGVVWYGDSTVVSTRAGKSLENDYEADYASFAVDRTFNNDMSTIGVSIAASNDVIMPSDAEEANRIRRAEKQSADLFLGYTQIFSKYLIVQTGVGTSRLEGYLSDPYKAGSLVNPQDRRPDEREEFTWVFGARYFLDKEEAALQFDYRFFTDDWGIDSHTLKLGFARDFGADWHFGVSARWYMQSEADFYEPYPVPQAVSQPTYFSMDYRLSPYGAVSVKLRGAWEFARDWSTVIVLERYISGEEFSFANIQLENPAVVSFMRGSVGVEYRF